MDWSILYWIQQHITCGFLDVIMPRISALGNMGMIWIAVAIVMNIDISQRNVIITHQFVTGAVRSESEDISVGGMDNVSASVFDDFDYVALGHIHRPQNIGSERIRYCGTPLKYSFSEASDEKSVTAIEMEEKGTLSVTEVPLTPLHGDVGWAV